MPKADGHLRGCCGECLIVDASLLWLSLPVTMCLILKGWHCRFYCLAQHETWLTLGSAFLLFPHYLHCPLCSLASPSLPSISGRCLAQLPSGLEMLPQVEATTFWPCSPALSIAYIPKKPVKPLSLKMSLF